MNVRMMEDCMEFHCPFKLAGSVVRGEPAHWLPEALLPSRTCDVTTPRRVRVCTCARACVREEIERWEEKLARSEGLEQEERWEVTRFGGTRETHVRFFFFFFFVTCRGERAG